MTATSVQFLSSRRVQLVGLPQGATSRQLPSITTNPAVSRIAHVASPQRVSRNLFGSPKTGEIEELLAKETAQRRSYMLQRYNFDILNPQAVDNPTKQSADTQTANQAYRFPSLIAKELLDHEKRLDGEGLCSSVFLSKAKTSAVASNSSNKSKKEEQETCDIFAIQGSDRLKPYTRQTLLTDCYSLRKANTSCNNKNAISFVAAPQPKQLGVLPLPKSIRAVESPISSSATYTDEVKEDSKSQQRETPYKQLV